MNIQLPMPPELARALDRIYMSLTVEQRVDLMTHKAKLIVIDNEVWYIDMDMKQEGGHD